MIWRALAALLALLAAAQASSRGGATHTRAPRRGFPGLAGGAARRRAALRCAPRRRHPGRPPAHLRPARWRPFPAPFFHRPLRSTAARRRGSTSASTTSAGGPTRRTPGAAPPPRRLPPGASATLSVPVTAGAARARPSSFTPATRAPWRGTSRTRVGRRWQGGGLWGADGWGARPPGAALRLSERGARRNSPRPPTSLPPHPSRPQA
jgi:hypothetical protein